MAFQLQEPNINNEEDTQEVKPIDASLLETDEVKPVVATSVETKPKTIWDMNPEDIEFEPYPKAFVKAVKLYVDTLQRTYSSIYGQETKLPNIIEDKLSFQADSLIKVIHLICRSTEGEDGKVASLITNYLETTGSSHSIRALHDMFIKDRPLEGVANIRKAMQAHIAATSRL